MAWNFPESRTILFIQKRKQILKQNRFELKWKWFFKSVDGNFSKLRITKPLFLLCITRIVKKTKVLPQARTDISLAHYHYVLQIRTSGPHLCPSRFCWSGIYLQPAARGTTLGKVWLARASVGGLTFFSQTVTLLRVTDSPITCLSDGIGKSFD